jgi:hypothetical protein
MTCLPPVAPDDTPTRLQRIAENLATDYYIGTFKHTDDIHFLLAEVSRLQQELQEQKSWAAGYVRGAELRVNALTEENALLRRSLEMLTKQLDEKDERITELTFTIVRHNSPA